MVEPKNKQNFEIFYVNYGALLFLIMVKNKIAYNNNKKYRKYEYYYYHKFPIIY